MMEILFFSIISFNQNFIRKKIKTKIRLREFLNKQESNSALPANCIGDLDSKYGSYLS